MPIGPAAAILGPVAGAAAGSLFGGGGASNAQPVLPKDLQGLRGQNIGLLQYLLGFNQPGMPWSQQQPQQQAPTGSGSGGPGGVAPTPQNPLGGGLMNPWSTPWGSPTAGPGWGGQVPAYAGGPIQRSTTQSGSPQIATEGPGFMDSARPGGQMAYSQSGLQPNINYQGTGGAPTLGGALGGAGGGLSQIGAGTQNPLSRIESFFGPLGTPTTGLQQQSLGGISQFLNSNPYGQSNNALQQLMGGGNYGESNQAFRDVGGQNYFGGAQNAFSNLGNSNNYQGANDIFSQLANFNPFGSAQNALEGQLTNNPGQGVLDALRPQFERNLAAANQTGGRFGSANALRGATALQDYNLLGAQALQQGVSQQQNAASILGQLGQALGQFRGAAGQGMLGVGQGQSQNQYNAGQGLLGVGQGQLSQGLGSAQGLAGNAANLGQQQLGAAQGLSQNANNQFNALQGAYGTGSAQAQQEAQRQQQALAILQNLLGASFGATLGVPSQVNPTGAQTGAQIGSGIGGYLAALGGGGSGSGMIPGNNVWGPASQYQFGQYGYNPSYPGAL